MRALEAELGWTFPAIKKQIDALAEAGVIEIVKDQTKRSITIHADVLQVLKNIFLFALKKDIVTLLQEHEFIIKEHYLGKVF
jgi:DNA-binding MarR family transcriptional regulator